MSTLDVLVIAAHPDDAEISVGGSLLRWTASGRRVGVIDLTRGEMGTRGRREDRTREAEAATKLLGLTVRRNLELPDGRVEARLEARETLARILREHRPRLVLAQHVEDLHPDHAACGVLAREAWYLSGLGRLAEIDGGPPAHRPRLLLHFAGHVPFEPTFVVDIEDFWEAKKELIRCYATQIEPQAPGDRGEHLLFGADILQRAETQARYWGGRIGRRFGEPLLHRGPLPMTDLLDLPCG